MHVMLAAQRPQHGPELRLIAASMPATSGLWGQESKVRVSNQLYRQVRFKARLPNGV